MKNTFFLLLLTLAFVYNTRSIQSIRTNNQPIDIIYLWVDGNDAEWQACRDKYITQELAARPIESETESVDTPTEQASSLIVDSATANRFANHDELRYSLRSVYAYAPFINHIYIVTMDQVPTWFKPHPAITFVSHKDIFKNAKDLPTFNSHALESNLHRIAGLNEHIIYFNDDVFLGGPVTEHDFFSDDKLNVLFEEGISPSGEPQSGETAYRRAWRNTNKFLDATYKTEQRHRLCHAPFALKKSYIEEFESQHPSLLAENSSHRFRSEHDFNVTNGLLQYYWLYKGLIVSHSFNTYAVNNIMVTLRDDSWYNSTYAKLSEVTLIRPATFCIEDCMNGKSIKTQELLHDFLENYFPIKAPWERD